MNTKLIECPECNGYGRIEIGCGGGCSSAYCYTCDCDACNGTGQARQLNDDDDDDIRDNAYDDWRQP